jgi:hypothetical protein
MRYRQETRDTDWIHGIQDTRDTDWIHGIQTGYTGYRLDTRDTD